MCKSIFDVSLAQAPTSIIIVSFFVVSATNGIDTMWMVHLMVPSFVCARIFKWCADEYKLHYLFAKTLWDVERHLLIALEVFASSLPWFVYASANIFVFFSCASWCSFFRNIAHRKMYRHRAKWRKMKTFCSYETMPRPPLPLSQACYFILFEKRLRRGDDSVALIFLRCRAMTKKRQQ